jgi:hypothetical protein
VMLYAVHRGHQDYGGGQSDVVHLVTTVRTAIATGQPWAFTDRHAEIQHALYFDSLTSLPQLDWNAVGAWQWGGAEKQDIKEQKQAEFLVHDRFPWTAVTVIGVANDLLKARVEGILRGGSHVPSVQVEPTWYY